MNIEEHMKRADILVSAVGKPKFITEDKIKKGAILIDVGINRVDGKLCGDIDFEEIQATISDNGGAIHSIDEVVAGKIIIDDASTPQDPYQG